MKSALRVGRDLEVAGPNDVGAGEFSGETKQEAGESFVAVEASVVSAYLLLRRRR